MSKQVLIKSWSSPGKQSNGQSVNAETLELHTAGETEREKKGHPTHHLIATLAFLYVFLWILRRDRHLDGLRREIAKLQWLESSEKGETQEHISNQIPEKKRARRSVTRRNSPLCHSFHQPFSERQAAHAVRIKSAPCRTFNDATQEGPRRSEEHRGEADTPHDNCKDLRRLSPTQPVSRFGEIFAWVGGC
ncbi:hypothetical protein cyc_00808 [Cyclospora cayetanensis]|uniref:Transmembrane protein n=1 Tax=Cyclospora cayetanensis TaxID=88456 RepID=A0A1D3CRS2_9EIME|nr:hypothetical protein cyc_00808 [Cyclospora cayetanensis]